MCALATCCLSRYIVAMSATSHASPTGTCPKCGASFRCGMEAGDKTCWCSRLPVLPEPTPGQGCLCPNCLKAAVEAQGRAETP